MGPRIAGAVLVAVGAWFFLQALAAAQDRGITVNGPVLAPIIVTGLWVVVASLYLITGGKPIEFKAWKTPLLLLLTLIGYAFVLKYTVAGYVLATAAFFLIAARLLSTRPIREVIVRDLAVAIGLSLGIYLSFTRLLGIVLPAGVLPL